MQVRIREGEDFEGMLKRFRSGVAKQGILSEVRKRQAFMTRSERQRLKARKAERKRLAKQMKQAA